MGYIITAQVSPNATKFFYHGNDRNGKPQFFWNIWNCSNRYFRIYKNKKTAERISKQVEYKMPENYKISVEVI